MNNVNKSAMTQQTIWSNLEWCPSQLQIRQFNLLQCLLKEWNKKVNLTKLIEGDAFWISQIFDSLWPIKNELQNQKEHIKVIDVGTGCGLPGLAFAIALPQASITLVDSINKKTHAVQEIAKEMGLFSRTRILTERIEVTGQNKFFRGTFDLAIARAVAKGPVLAEYLIPLLKPKGQAIIYKGKWSEIEETNLSQALSQLNAGIERIDTIELPKNRGIRHAIRIASQNYCPQQYPRSIGIPVKHPLGN